MTRGGAAVINKFKAAEPLAQFRHGGGATVTHCTSFDLPSPALPCAHHSQQLDLRSRCLTEVPYPLPEVAVSYLSSARAPPMPCPLD